MRGKFKKRCFLILLLLPFFTLSLIAYSPTVNTFFTSNEKKLVMEGTLLTSVSLKGKGEVATPGVEKLFPVKSAYIHADISSFDMSAVEKGFFRMTNSGPERERIYRGMTDVNSLKGMLYYSQSEKKVLPLILGSYRLPSKSGGTETPGGIPEKRTDYFAIKDNRLGILTFRSEFISRGDIFIVSSVLTGTAEKFGMRIFNPGDYRIYRIVFYSREQKGYFFYTLQLMKVRSDILKSFDIVKPESFGNRVRAEDIHFLKSIGAGYSAGLAAFR